MRPSCRFPCRGVARNRNGIPASRVPVAAFHLDVRRASCSSLGSIPTRDRTPPRSSTATSRSLVRCRCRPIVDNATGCCAGPRRSNRAYGLLKARTAMVRCWRNSSSRRASMSLMCRPRCRPGPDCWTLVARTRPTRTTRAPPRSSRYGTGICARSGSSERIGCSATTCLPEQRSVQNDVFTMSGRAALARRRAEGDDPTTMPEARQRIGTTNQRHCAEAS